jgi:hypothetical protein
MMGPEFIKSGGFGLLNNEKPHKETGDGAIPFTEPVVPSVYPETQNFLIFRVVLLSDLTGDNHDTAPG